MLPSVLHNPLNLPHQEHHKYRYTDTFHRATTLQGRFQYPAGKCTFYNPHVQNGILHARLKLFAGVTPYGVPRFLLLGLYLGFKEIMKFDIANPIHMMIGS